MACEVTTCSVTNVVSLWIALMRWTAEANFGLDTTTGSVVVYNFNM
jgi:hypothetical protein